MIKQVFKIVGFWFLFICLAGNLYAIKNYKFKRITVDDGLSQGNVNSMVQDKHGFMWFGTKDGLNRYDGYSFRVYKPDKDVPGSISDNRIWSLFVDSDSVLWVGTDGGGLNRYNRSSDSFDNFIHNDNDPFSLAHNSVYAIHEDKFGFLWVGTYGGGVSVMDRKTGRFVEHYKNIPGKQNSLSADKVRRIFEDREGNLWVGIDEYTNGGLNRFDRKKKKFVRYQHNPADSNTIGSNIVLDVLVDKDSSFWLGSWAAGITHFNPKTKECKVYKNDPADPNSISSNETFAFCRDRKGRLWVSTRKGLDLYDEEIDGFIHFKNDPLIPTTITQDVVISLYEDKFGVLWIGLEGAGICTFDTEAKQFEHYVNDYKDDNSLINNNVTTFAEDRNGNVWVGTSANGISILDVKNEIFTNLTHDPNKPNSLSHYNVNCIFEDSKGLIWIGYNGGGLDRYNPETGKIKNFSENDKGDFTLTNNAIFCIDEDKEGNLWLGTYGEGIYKLDPVSEKFYNYSIDAENDMNDVAWCLLVDKDGDVWVGSGGHGLLNYEKATDHFIYYRKEEDRNSVCSNVVMDLYEDDNGFIWIASGGAGVDKLDKEKMHFTNYSTDDGLINDMVSSVVGDEYNNIWISTIKGLSKLSLNDSVVHFSNFDKYDGLQDNNFNAHAKLISSKGYIYLGGVNGFNRFYPTQIVDNKTKPILSFTDFSIFGKSQGPRVEGSKIDKAIWEVDHITLSHKDYSFSFEFSAIHFAAPNKNGYMYKMEGFDENWIKTTADRRFANYTNLPAGDYKFKVRATNSDGVAAENELSLSIEITAPYYKTFWFWALVALFVVILIVSFFRYREIAAGHQRKLLEKKVNEAVVEMEKQKAEIVLQNEELQKRKKEDELQKWYTSGLADFGEILRENKDDLTSLGKYILENLVHYIDAIQGGLFVVDDEDSEDVHLKMIATFGYDAESNKHKRIEIGEGLVGTCFKDKQIKHMTDFPDNYLKINSGLGEGKPKELLLVPLKLDDLLYGVVELSTINTFRPIDIKFVEKLGESITSTLFTAKISLQTQYLLEQSRQQAEELKSQEEESRQNIEEMEANREEAMRIKSEMMGYMNSVNHSVIRCDFDLNGDLVYANSKFLDLMGYSSKEAYQMSVTDFFFDEDKDAFMVKWLDLLNGGHHIEEYYNHKTKDGSISLLSTFTTVRDVEGQIVKVLYLGLSVEGGLPGASSTLTDLHVIDRFLMRAELDKDGGLINANALMCQFLGHTIGELQDLMMESFISADMTDKYSSEFESLISNKIPFYFDFSKKMEDGTEITKTFYFEMISSEMSGDKIVMLEVNSKPA